MGLKDKSLSTPIPRVPFIPLISSSEKYPSSDSNGEITYPKQILLSIEISVIYHVQPSKNSFT